MRHCLSVFVAMVIVCSATCATLAAEKKAPLEELWELRQEILDLQKVIAKHIKPKPDPADKSAAAATEPRTPDNGCSGVDPCDKECQDSSYSSIMNLMCSLLKAEDAIRKDIEHRRKLRGSITVGVNGDKSSRDEPIQIGDVESSGKERFQVRSTVKFSAGGYPNEFRGSWGLQTRYEDGHLEEDMTEAIINYDHYFSDRVETFVFLERFSDSYLSLDQRWEVGAGVDFEFKGKPIDTLCGVVKITEKQDQKTEEQDQKTEEQDQNACNAATQSSRANNGDNSILTNLTPEGKKLLKWWHELSDLGIFRLISERGSDEQEVVICPDTFNEQMLKLLEGEENVRLLIRSIRRILEIAEEQHVRVSIRNRKTKFEFSIGIALLGETERFEFVTQPVDSAGDPTGADPVTAAASNTQTRVSIRPAIRYRPKDDLEIRALLYYKKSMFGGGPTGKDDYRLHGNIDLSYELKATLFGAKVKVGIEYDYRYDNAPPSILEASLPDLPLGEEYRPVTADDTHQIFTMNLGLNW